MKLFLTTGSTTQIFSFNKFPILIGSDSPPHVTLSIPDLESIHLKIIDKDGTPFVVNQVNDPFVSLNGMPFYKKKIKHDDVLELNQQTKIRFELVEGEPKDELPPRAYDLKPIKIKDLEETEPTPTAPLPQLGKVSGLDPIGLGKNLRITCTIFGIILILFAFIASAFYTKAVTSAEIEEVTAAEGVADIAMALKHAQVHNLKPKKHNWSDPEFIKNNLAAVLTHDCPSISNLDVHGQFSNCPYLLRTYASHDFSHFIVIAQPNPSVLHWLIPKKTIVVDSRLMELRKVQDIRALNRLLINANILNDDDSTQVTKLIQEGELIPLTALASHRCYQGFTPPKALALTHPGAENRIYNAPRYHHFGESIVRRALSMGIHADNPAEMARLRQEMEKLARFPDTVLYTSQGMEMAMQTRRALSTILPDSHFLLGYLKYNAEGNLVSSNLILDHNLSEIVTYDDSLFDEDPPETDEWINIQLILENAARKLEAQYKDKEESLAARLAGLAEKRRERLEPITKELTRSLQDRLNNAGAPQHQEVTALFKKYQHISNEQDAVVKEELIKLYYNYVNLPFDEFIQTVNNQGLGNWLPDWIRE